MAHSYKQNTKLTATQLKKHVDPSLFTFDTTEEVPELTSIVGQERGRAVMEFGLHIDQEGYNIYVSGISGTGKTSFTNSLVKDFARRDVTLFDWCYVYNFTDKSYRPQVLKLPVGKGKHLKRDMERLMKELQRD